ncbi:tetratricopeptide repeat protein [candidate division KSB1 bacterium]|nr:tetratricopeptide repeat protein [candidate division KSB1 bacterium]
MVQIFLMNAIFSVPATALITLVIFFWVLLLLLKSLPNRNFLIQLILFVTISSILIIKCHPPTKGTPDVVRIAILPFEKSELSSADRWLGWGVEEYIFESLRPDPVGPIQIYDLDNLRKIIRLDSLADPLYLQKFAQKVNLDYFISGRITIQSGWYQIQYDIMATTNGSILTDTVKFRNIKELHAIGLIIANKTTKTLPSGQNGFLCEKKTQDALASRYFFQAKELLFDNKIEDAKALLNQSIAKFPDAAKNYALAGRCCLLEAAQSQARGNPFQPAIEKAKFFLTTALTLDSTDTKIQHYLAQYYIFTHNWIAADKEIQNSYCINSKDPELYVLMAQLNPSRFTKFGFKNEVELLEHALSLNPGHLSAALSLSQHYVDYLQDPGSAINVIKRALVINPEQPDLLVESGRLYVISGEFLEIMPVYAKIMEIAPSNANAFYNLGIYYYNQKDYQNASRLFERAIEIDAHLDSHLYLAYIYEQMALKESNSERYHDYLDKAIENFRYRVKHKRDSKDAYAEVARNHLYNLINN